MKFIEPDIQYKEKAREYIQEFIDAGSEIINGSGALDSYLVKEGYEAWLEEVERKSDVARKKPGEINDSTFFYVREEDEFYSEHYDEVLQRYWIPTEE